MADDIADVLKELSEAWGPSGREGAVREVVRRLVEPHVDEMRVDALGSLICVRRARRAGGIRVMFSAHMDEIGVIVSDIDERGFLRVSPVGGVSASTLVGQRMRFENGVVGCVGHEPVEDARDLRLPRLWVDVGARSREEAEEAVGYGSMAVFDRDFAEGRGFFTGKAMDDRGGCAVLVAALRAMEAPGNEVVAVFSVQEEVGLRGARAAAFGVEPELGVAVDVTPAGDTPKSPPGAVRMGGGAAIKAMDQSLVTPRAVMDLMRGRAEEAGIAHQIEVLGQGGTDAGAIHLSREGVPSGCVSIPIRCLHTPAEMVARSDLEAARDLVRAIAEIPVEAPLLPAMPATGGGF